MIDFYNQEEFFPSNISSIISVIGCFNYSFLMELSVKLFTISSNKSELKQQNCWKSEL